MSFGSLVFGKAPQAGTTFIERPDPFTESHKINRIGLEIIPLTKTITFNRQDLLRLLQSGNTGFSRSLCGIDPAPTR